MVRKIGIVFVFALVATALSLMSTAVAQDYPLLSTPPQLEQMGQNDAAVIVGVEDYLFLTDIDGVVDTVNDWETFFVRGLGIPDTQIHTLVNSQATRERMMTRVERAAESVKDGGTLWFVFVGHGVPNADGDDGVLVGVDAQSDVTSLVARGVERSELLELLEQGSQAQTMVILDACFSGRASDGHALAEGLQRVVPEPERMNREFEPEDSTLVMAAAQADEYAGPLPGMRRPAFSYVLLGALRGWASADGEVTASDAIHYTRQHLRQLDHSQTPNVQGDVDLVLSRGATEEDPQLASLMRAALRGPTSEAERRVAAEEPTAGSEQVPEGYVEIPAGTFTQGSPESEAGRYDREGPQREVEITRPFLLKETPVTQGEWKEVMGRIPTHADYDFTACGDDCPVVLVNWYEAVMYVNLLSQREGLEQCYEVSGCGGEFAGGCEEGDGNWCNGDFECERVEFRGLDCEGYRLPTEAEWEYAARAGTTEATYAGDLMILGRRNAPLLDDIAVYGGNSGVDYESNFHCSGLDETQYDAEQCGIHEVGTKRSNAWGLYDMIGNVREWTNDRFGEYEAESQTDPTNLSSNWNHGNALASVDLIPVVIPRYTMRVYRRVLRGCSWNDRAGYCRAAYRGDRPAFRRYDDVGLRPARSL